MVLIFLEGKQDPLSRFVLIPVYSISMTMVHFCCIAFKTPIGHKKIYNFDIAISYSMFFSVHRIP